MFRYLVLAAFIFSVQAVINAAEEREKNEVFWAPSIGDTWTYKVVMEVAKETSIPTDIEGQKIEELDGKIRATYHQTAVYRGFLPISDGGPKAHAFYFSNGKQLEEIQYMLIEENAVKAIGSKQEGKTPQKLISLNKPIPLVSGDWKGGESFPVIMNQNLGGKQIRMTRMFRAIGWEQLETKAGSFEALHVQLTGMNAGLELKRGYWFTPRIGFIREDKKYYLGDKMIMSQTRELVKTGSEKPDQKSGDQ